MHDGREIYDEFTMYAASTNVKLVQMFKRLRDIYDVIELLFLRRLGYRVNFLI